MCNFRKIEMRLLVVLACAILAVNAASDDELWSQFKKTHGKSYRNLREEQKRFAVFQDNIRKIETHNAQYAKGEKSYTLGATVFADLTHEEFLSLFNTSGLSTPTFEATPLDHIALADVPDEIDWRTKG
ncbi:hypothetical protein NQ317_007467 [Molorchus minor]|uniref:Cathepsin propeptide inhibitor domain-containing protein n=1 Tax=Molorchus minor TaxID=1323400 RepID=A0ABQ9K0U8_9CUCU|nr:hypothetical protein NQ317_007467 [Molorchus minor]